jgi:hypothetical protein
MVSPELPPEKLGCSPSCYICSLGPLDTQKILLSPSRSNVSCWVIRACFTVELSCRQPWLVAEDPILFEGLLLRAYQGSQCLLAHCLSSPDRQCGLASPSCMTGILAVQQGVLSIHTFRFKSC